MRATRPGQSALLLVDIVEILRDEDIQYAVIGAFALAALGTIRASRDADALLHLDFGRFTRLEERFKSLGLRTSMQPPGEDDPVLGMLILSDSHGNQVDLLGGLKGMDPRLFSRAVEIPFAGTTLRIISREDFIAMKCFAGGSQDLSDARSAYQNAHGPLDMDLLRAATRRFGRDAADRLENILAA